MTRAILILALLTGPASAETYWGKSGRTTEQANEALTLCMKMAAKMTPKDDAELDRWIDKATLGAVCMTQRGWQIMKIEPSDVSNDPIEAPGPITKGRT